MSKVSAKVKHLIETQEQQGGITAVVDPFAARGALIDRQRILLFDNGYGLSVVWDDTQTTDDETVELAVVDRNDRNFLYLTRSDGPIFDYVPVDDFASVLRWMAALPKTERITPENFPLLRQQSEP